MITTRLYLDCRDSAPGSPAPLKFVITKNKVRALLSLNIRIDPSCWDQYVQKAKGGYEKLNRLILQKKTFIDSLIFQMESAGELIGLKSSEIKKLVEARLYGEGEELDLKDERLFVNRFKSFMASRPSEGTRTLYSRTLDRMMDFEGDNLYAMKFDDINVKWLKDFDVFLAKTSPARNARNIHFRNIRAVFNDAIMDDMTESYPFRKFKLKYEKTRKRALPLDRLREIMTSEPVEKWERRYADCFKLIFLLCGINIVDLYNLVELRDGRIEYSRAKTHRPYSIKVEPEAMEIIERWKGEKNLLCYSDTTKNYRMFYNRLARYLKELGISTYWARHSWSTIARNIGISKDTIAQALGHGGNTVTDIYIDEDVTLVDEANRKVIDWVFYGKKN